MWNFLFDLIVTDVKIIVVGTTQNGVFSYINDVWTQKCERFTFFQWFQIRKGTINTLCKGTQDEVHEIICRMDKRNRKIIKQFCSYFNMTMNNNTNYKTKVVESTIQSHKVHRIKISIGLLIGIILVLKILTK